jgi:hypothetical protein
MFFITLALYVQRCQSSMRKLFSGFFCDTETKVFVVEDTASASSPLRRFYSLTELGMCRFDRKLDIFAPLMYSVGNAV